MIIGAHLSASKGYVHMLDEAVSIGANTFQFFTRNPRGGKAKELDLNDAALFNEKSKAQGVNVILAHAPYTLNCCSAKPEVRQFAIETFADDLKRMEATPGMLYNFHPGSHVGQGEEEGIRFIAETLNTVLRGDMTTTVLLETMAGKGTEIGKSFEELQSIIERVELSDKIGVCLDTCHVFDAGYDIVNDLDGVLEHFDKIIGINRLRALHLNDSKNPFASHKDRHEKIGLGSIGEKAFENIVNNKYLRDLPMFLETPNELSGYKAEIALLRSLQKISVMRAALPHAFFINFVWWYSFAFVFCFAWLCAADLVSCSACGCNIQYRQCLRHRVFGFFNIIRRVFLFIAALASNCRVLHCNGSVCGCRARFNKNGEVFKL